MTSIEIIKSQLDVLKSETESNLLVAHPVNNDNQDYWTANYKGWILDPFIKKVGESIKELEYNEYLLKKLNSWIIDLNQFLEDDLKKIATKKNYPHQLGFIKYFVAKLSGIKNGISSFINSQEEKQDVGSNDTILTRTETALLMLYLQETKAILPNSLISDSKLSNSFEILTGYKGDQLRKDISSKKRIFRNELTTNLKNYNKLKVVFSSMIELIDKDIASFN